MVQKVFKVTSFSLEDTPENDALLKQARILAIKDGWTFSHIIRTALGEYIERHSPGNPQLILGHWQSQIPLPQSTQEQHKHSWHGHSDGAGIWYTCDQCGKSWVPP